MSGSGRSEQLKTGLKLAFGAVLFCALLVTWGLGQASKYSGEARYHSEQYAKYTREKVGQGCVGPMVPDKADCVEQAAKEAREYERNEQDLVAQRQSALWGFIMAVAAVIGMGLSAVGVFLVWTTFNETRKANDIADRFNSLTLRPIVIVSPDQVSLSWQSDGVNVTGNFKIYYKNVGQTIAHNVRVTVESFVAPDTDDDFIRPSDDLIPYRLGSLAPKTESWIEQIPIVMTKAERTRITQTTRSENCIFLCGRIDYDGVDDVRFCTNFRFFTYENGISGGNLMQAHHGNWIT